MARFAIVAPISIVDQLFDRGALGYAHLLLAHDVVQHPKEYKHYFHPDNMISPNRLIILDNSVVELGGAVDHRTMVEAAGIVIPNIIILPDIKFNMNGTISEASKSLDLWDKVNTQGWAPTFMFCLQGTALTEYVSCAHIFKDSRVTTWGIPRDVLNVMPSRKPLIDSLRFIEPRKKIHLLGFSDNIEDDVLCAITSEVQSIDSAVPLRYQCPLGLNSKVPPRGNWWDNPPLITDTVLKNLRRVRRWVGDTTIKDSI